MNVQTLKNLDALYARVDEKIYQRRDLGIIKNYRFNRIRDRVSLEIHRRLKERLGW